MIFSLVYSYFLSQQSGKQLIVLIDEPELHMHPALQEQLVSFILKISVTAQVFISTHSPLLIKQLASNNTVKILILKNGCRLASMEERKLPYDSSNEINYIAFNLVTQEYHNELYEELKYKFGENIGYKEFDNKFFVQRHKEPPSYPWKELKNQVSLHTYLRNQIHHPQENGTLDKDELRISIERLRLFLSDGFYPSDL